MSVSCDFFSSFCLIFFCTDFSHALSEYQIQLLAEFDTREVIRQVQVPNFIVFLIHCFKVLRALMFLFRRFSQAFLQLILFCLP
jgi:hypothetical protein